MENKVHEVLGGYKTMSCLPIDEEWCLLHPKTIERQENKINIIIHYEYICRYRRHNMFLQG